MKIKNILPTILGFMIIHIPSVFFGQAYQRSSKNIGLVGGFSKVIDQNQTSFQLGIASQINRYLIPELNYKITSINEESRLSNASDIHFISPAIQFRTRFLRTPARKVRGICTQEFMDFGLTPECFFILNPNQINVDSKKFFALRTSLILFRYKSGMRKSQKAWSFKAETFYRHNFGSDKHIGNEIGLNLRITRFQVYNFLK
jgi:hypothetical protein